MSPLTALDRLYEDNVDHVYLNSLEQRRRSAEDWLKIVKKYCNNDSRRLSLIDVGCATGVFLDCAESIFRVEGVELSQWAASIASQRHLVHRKPLSNLALTQKFDVATLWGVIEHFDDPRREISALRDSLAPGGLLFIYTGDRSAFIPRLLRKRWWWYQGMHLQYFTKDSLSLPLKETGFTVIASKRLPIYFSLASLGQSLNRYRWASPVTKLLSLLPQKRLLIKLTLSGEMLMIAKAST